MATTGKRLIPVELLRRSCRNKSTSSGTCHESIKKETIEPDEDVGVSLPTVPPRKRSKRVELSPSPIIKQEPIVCERQKSGSLDLEDNRLKLEAEGYLEVDGDELDLERTLMGGQSFRWHGIYYPNYGERVFTGVIGNSVLQLWRSSNTQVAFRKLNQEGVQASKDIESILREYFQLKYDLKVLYKDWSESDRHFAICSQTYKGFRILRQNPVENVFSFICATNNNIKRISQMIDKMCCHFGDRLEYRSGEARGPDEAYRTFPTVERLAQDDVFNSLRYDLGFGYRAKFICETAKKLISLSAVSKLSPSDYLLSLRAMPYKDTCKQLQAFPGIGRKVADCICLMSMDHLNSVPIDCHIYEIVCRNYMPNLRNERKTLTESVHDLIGSYFNDLHGPLAGWATSVLFIAELKHLKQEAPETGNAKKGKPVKTDQAKRRKV